MSSSSPPPSTTPGDSSRRSQPASSQARRRGRRIARVLYYVMAGAIATTATVQITQQLFFPDDPAQSEPPQSCETGLAVLHEAVIRARAQVERDTTAVGALPRYRAEVARGWQHHAAVRTLCADNPVHSSTLDSLERLRYAEGRGVRSYGAELAALRRHVADRIVREQTEQ